MPSLTLPRACITGSISLDEEVLAVLIPGAIVIASLNTVTISQTIELEGAEKATHLEWQPGRQYALLFSTPELTKLYHINRNTLAVETSHSFDNRAVPSLTTTAFNPSGTRLVLQHKPDPPAEESHLEVWTTTTTSDTTAPPTLDATLATSSSTAATSWNPTAPFLAFSTLSSTTSAPALDDSASSSLEPPSPLHIWDITAPNSTNNPRPVTPPPQHLQPWRHAFSPCGTYIALSAGTHGLVWNALSGTLLADVSVAAAWWARCLPAWQPATDTTTTIPRVAFGGAGGAVTVVRLQVRRGEEEEVQAVVEQERQQGQQDGGTMEVLAGEVDGVGWVDGGKRLMFDTGRDGGVEVWCGERNVKWRMVEQPAAGEEQQEKRKKGVVARWCEGRRMVVVLDREVGVVRFWRMP